MKTAVLIFGFLFFCGNCFALEPKDYASFFEIDMDEEFPSFKELEQKYFHDSSDYEPKYAYRAEIGNVFDKEFRQMIASYGSSEKRLKSPVEDDYMDMINSVPKEMYPYIGPQLHIAYGVPEKIKNMPGIKETKNKFPQRIAPQLADIENIEFLSPHLYFLLMPEIWPENNLHVEYVPQKIKTKVKADISPNVMEKVMKIVPPEDFYPDAKEKTSPQRSDLRTLNPTKDSALTSGDIKAFAATLDKLDKFAKSGQVRQKVFSAGTLLDAYETDNGKALPLNNFKDLVNPCQRLVQKIKIAGLESEFRKILAEDGFEPKGWAYTCDKTIKAYRKSRMTTFMMRDLQDYRHGVYEDYMRQTLSPRQQAAQFAAIQTNIEMYASPVEDVLEAMKNAELLREQFRKINFMIVTAPVSL